MRKRFWLLLLPLLLGAQPRYVKKTVCASGCDYPLTQTDLQHALDAAAAYQLTTACVPYIIEQTGNITTTSYLVLRQKPKETCAQYVTLRSSRWAEFTPGKRYDPATDDAKAAGLVASPGWIGAFMALADYKSDYYRFVNYNFTTAAVVSGAQATFSVTGASWSGGTETITLSGDQTASCANGTWSINGVVPAGYNIGNVTVTGESAGSISFNTGASGFVPTSSPGAYVSGGTATCLHNYLATFAIDWSVSGGNFDMNQVPSHHQLIQSSIRGSGTGDLGHGVNLGFDDVVQDNYFGGLANQGADTTAIGALATRATIRNNYISSLAEGSISGGSPLHAGRVPSFVSHIGNYYVKEPWAQFDFGASVPTQPCWQGNIYLNTTTNVSYICGSTSGSWTAQSTLDNHANYGWPYKGPANHLEVKAGSGFRIAGNSFGVCPGRGSQSCISIFLSLTENSYPYATCTQSAFNDPQPCFYVPAPWSTIQDFDIRANDFHDAFSPFVMAGAIFYSKRQWIYLHGTDTYSITGNGTNVVDTTGSSFPSGYNSASQSSQPNVLIDGVSYVVDSSTSTSATVEGVVASGPHTLVVPTFTNGHNHIRFENNLSHNYADERSMCTGADIGGAQACVFSPGGGTRAGGPVPLGAGDFDLSVQHNTMLASATTSASGKTSGPGFYTDPIDSGQVIVRNNILPAGVNGFYSINLADPGSNGCSLENSLNNGYGGVLNLSKNILYRQTVSGETWQTFATGSVNPGCAGTATAIWPTDHAGVTNWSSVLDTSTYAVTNPTYTGWGSDGRDPGADVPYVNAMTAHAIDGLPNPVLDFGIRSVVNLSGPGVRIYATSIDATACTWELSADPNLYASPITASTVVQTGRDIVATWSSVTPLTAYFARLTCNSVKSETLPNGARAMVVSGPPPHFTGWQYQSTVTFPAASGSSTLTDWTGAFTASNPLLATVANGGAIQHTVSQLGVMVPADFALTTDATCTTVVGYAWDIEAYDAAAGTLTGWVRMTLTTGAPVVPTACIGNTTVATWLGGPRGSAYDSHTLAAFHFGSTSALNLNDFSSHANNLTNHSAVVAGTGKLAGDAVFSGGADSFLTLASPIVAPDLTVECWAKPSSFGMLIETDPVNSEMMLFWDTSQFVWRGNQGSLGIGTGTQTSGIWYHVAGTSSSGTPVLYLNGAPHTSGTFITPGTTGTATNIGAWGASPGSDRLNGSIDEARIVDMARSADWVANDYSNQSSPPAMSALVPTATVTMAPRIFYPFEHIDGNDAISTGLSPQGIANTGQRGVIRNLVGPISFSYLYYYVVTASTAGGMGSIGVYNDALNQKFCETQPFPLDSTGWHRVAMRATCVLTPSSSANPNTFWLISTPDANGTSGRVAGYYSNEFSGHSTFESGYSGYQWYTNSAISTGSGSSLTLNSDISGLTWVYSSFALMPEYIFSAVSF